MLLQLRLERFRQHRHDSLGGSGNRLFVCQAGDECSNLRLSHLCWVPFVMKENVSFDPFNVGLLGADTVMLHPNHLLDLVEELGHDRRILLTNPGFMPRFRGLIHVGLLTYADDMDMTNIHGTPYPDLLRVLR